MKAECYLLFPLLATLFNGVFVAVIQHSRVAHAWDVAVHHAADDDLPPRLGL